MLHGFGGTGSYDAAFRLLEGIRPEKAAPEALVFRAPNGKKIKSVGTWWNAAVLEVWEPSRPSEKRPRFHDLRKTAGTRIENPAQFRRKRSSSVIQAERSGLRKGLDFQRLASIIATLSRSGGMADAGDSKPYSGR